mmetsp:Transcript_197/g.531  ORF Transcript_197/g.531 Transcript_197/m.531 type:complete len:92 (-) Transcript_197:2856-3131(-)
MVVMTMVIRPVNVPCTKPREIGKVNFLNGMVAAVVSSTNDPPTSFGSSAMELVVPGSMSHQSVWAFPNNKQQPLHPGIAPLVEPSYNIKNL